MTPDDAPTDPPWLSEYLAGRLDPDPPTAADWARVRRCVFARVPAPDRPCWARRAAWGVLAGTAGAAVWVVTGTPAPVPETPAALPVTVALAPPPREARPDPLAPFDVLPVAGPADVRIEAVFGNKVPVFAGFDTLLPGGLDLAGHGDVLVESIRHDPESGPEPRMVGGPADVPMIYAAARR